MAANKNALCVLTHSGQKQIHTLQNWFSHQDFSEKQKFWLYRNIGVFVTITVENKNAQSLSNDHFYRKGILKGQNSKLWELVRCYRSQSPRKEITYQNPAGDFFKIIVEVWECVVASECCAKDHQEKTWLKFYIPIFFYGLKITANEGNKSEEKIRKECNFSTFFY